MILILITERTQEERNQLSVISYQLSVKKEGRSKKKRSKKKEGRTGESFLTLVN
ncbi:hypothetical protein [Okeania sp. KiyG1]|uniref:hypothetical protein n=1 Tax=Okeania sp. KiyG1 TaxID=2720165 RepID=UPI001920C45F|nr:hypothetical protein [Okeania sp. KiyG1]